MDSGLVRIAAIADLHCEKSSGGYLQGLFKQISDSADVALLCGDLTDYGLTEETKVLVSELAVMKIPVVAVLGNHDFESGNQVEVKKILVEAGVRVLDGDVCEIHGVGFAGVKGFCGGFDRGALQPWGEEMIKHFVREGIEEALKLESALAKLREKNRVVLVHYSPIRDTVEGEPLEIFPFLGSSRLEDPINRYQVSAVFHGHAHHGAPEGRTGMGVPVYNVALPLMKKLHPDKPFRVLELKKE